MKTLHRIAFTLLVLCAGAARGSTLDVAGWALGESVDVVGHGTVATAELGITVDGYRGFSYCVDLAQSIGPGASDAWEVGSPSTDALIRASFLVDTFRPQFEAFQVLGTPWGGQVSQATAIAALQVAVWEVVSDAPGDYSLSGGAFALADGLDGDVALIAGGMLEAASQADLTDYTPGALVATHATLQDQLFTPYGAYVQPIPEPGTVGTYAAGFALAALALRKRRT